MKAYYFLSILVLAAAGKASAAGTFVPRSAVIPSQTEKDAKLEIRGGAARRSPAVKGKGEKNKDEEASTDLSPFNKGSVTKFATVLFGLNAGYLMLAPGKALEKFGFENTPLLEYMMEWLGHISMSQAISSYCLHFKETSVKTAVGCGTLWLLVSTIKSLLNDLPQQFGFSANGQLTFLVINAFCAQSLLSDGPIADKVLIGYPIWGLLNAAMFVFAPENIGKQWGVEGDVALTFAVKNIGIALATKSVHFLSLALGEEKTKAFGYGLLPSLLGLLSNTFITKEPTTLGLPQGITNAWIMVLFVFAAFLLL